MSLDKLTRDQVARYVAAAIAPGSYVNVGLGIPVLVAKYLDPAKEVILHSENGILGLEDLPPGERADEDLINASKTHVRLIPGSSITDQATSFAMMRGGHLDATILGAFQVSSSGDIASWSTGDPDAIPGIGGAMDLVAGAKRVIVVMDHLTRGGESKLVSSCTYPLTGMGVVTDVYTDLCAITLDRERGFVVHAIAEGLTPDAVQSATAAPLSFAASLDVMRRT